MRVIQWVTIGVLGFWFTGCATVSTAPTPEVRQALAPTGKLRVGFIAAPTNAVKDPVTGELKGVAVDLGKEMARRAGVPFEAVAYTAFPPFLAGAKAGEWDIAMMGIQFDRAQIVDFTGPYMIVEFSFLVPSGSSISTFADIDKPGVRIAVLAKSSPDAELSGTVRNASVVRFATIAELFQSLGTGKADAIYGTQTGLLGQSGKFPGSRVLEGHFGGERTAIALPKGRLLAATYAGQFVEAVKAEGLVKSAIERAGLRGVVVAPPK